MISEDPPHYIDSNLSLVSIMTAMLWKQRVGHDWLMWSKQRAVIWCGLMIFLFKTQKIWNWCRAILVDWQKFISLNGASSIVKPIAHAVPQSSVLGSVLFPVMVNDVQYYLQMMLCFLLEEEIYYNIEKRQIICWTLNLLYILKFELLVVEEEASGEATEFLDRSEAKLEPAHFVW